MLHKIVKGYINDEGEWRTEEYLSPKDEIEYRLGKNGTVETIKYEGYENEIVGWEHDVEYRALLGMYINGTEVYQGDTLIGQYGGHYLEYSDSTGFYFSSDDGDIINLEQIDESDEIFVGYNRHDSPEKKSVDEKAAVDVYCAKKISGIMRERYASAPKHELNNTLYCVEEEVSFRSPLGHADVIVIAGINGEEYYGRDIVCNFLREYNLEYGKDEMDRIDAAIDQNDYRGLEKALNQILERNGAETVEIIGYIKDTRRHGIFFTEKACNDHIKRMGLNYCNPKCVKVGSEDNQEMEDVLNFLMAMTTGLPSSYLVPAPTNRRRCYEKD